MKHLCSYLWMAAFAWLAAACSNPGEAVIYGKVTEPWDGKEISLTINGNSGARSLETTTIEDGKFKFKMEPDTPFVATLRMEMDDAPFLYLLPVAVEPGRIEVLLGRETMVSGTPLNEKLQQFILDKDDFVAADTTSGDAKQEAFRKFVEGQVAKYGDTPVLVAFIERAYSRKYR